MCRSVTVLGAVLAGGQSRRYGADKALALLDGQPLIAHVAARLAAECGQVVVCGREWGRLPALADRPRGGLGPLGGLCAALAWAAERGHDAVLCAPCDMPELPAGLLQSLSPGPAVADGQWLLGLWPADLGPALHRLLLAEGAVSMRRFVSEAGARTVALGPMRNVNFRHDLLPKQPGPASD